ncbi:MAG: hypothetical protein KC897_06630 [Candidatus Omnitrophica bacterium]|nr:hypothetical protein [Candidatus Omnitrophota bacterium]
MPWRVGLGAALCFLLGSSPALAEDVAEKAKKLAVEYSNAQTRGDQARKSEIYDEIVADEDIVNQIRSNYRDTYHLLKLQSTERKLDRMQSRYGTRRPQTRPPRSPGILQSGTTSTSSVGSDSGAPQGNSAYTQNFANQNRAPNQVRSSTSNSRVRGTNSEVSRSFSNRVRARSQSNQRRLRQRR